MYIMINYLSKLTRDLSTLVRCNNNNICRSDYPNAYNYRIYIVEFTKKRCHIAVDCSVLLKRPLHATQPFRCMYPGGHGDYAGFPGCGLLRLHSTYRHDLKIYASDEGRVQMTAAAFAKGLLALEGELPPILVQMVKSANTNGLLDDESEQLSKYQNT